MLIDNNRLINSLARMESSIQPASSCPGGVAYSTASRDALRQLARLLQSAGMMTHSDLAGNLVGRLEGKQAWPPLIMGARIDTAPVGDRCVGFAGIMAAVEVARTLHDNGTVLDHPLEIIVWSDSAGRMLGSRSFHESITRTEISSRTDGDTTVADGIGFLGGSPDKLLLNQRAKGTIAAYLEMQTEPDASQWSSSAELGVVQQFAGIQRWSVQLVSDASNRTDSEQRRQLHDAASRFSAAIADLQQPESDRQVTRLDLSSTSATASNNRSLDIRFRLDIRAHNPERIDSLFTVVRERAERISQETATRFVMEPVFGLQPSETDPQVSEAIIEAASQLGLSYLPRRGAAGHDAQGLSTLAPVGVIIVPGGTNGRTSRSGDVLPEAFANGANTLLRTLLQLD
ncbi:MAG: M20/M25/M40 family metallo-hydrolase, partial [Woeseia sp.]